LGSLWRLWDGSAAEEERAVEDVPPSQSPVFLDELPVEEGEEEDDDDQSDTASNAENASCDLSSSPIVKVKRRSL